MFTGCGTALVTPFDRNQALDEATLRKLVRRQIEAGINFLVPCGTTGESPTLTRAEHLRVVEIALEEAKGKVPVLGGAGGATWEFAPGATVTLDVGPVLTVGVEYYGGFGPIDGFDPPDSQSQQLFPVVWLHVAPEWEVNAGAGFGLTPATDRLTAKLIVGRRF